MDFPRQFSEKIAILMRKQAEEAEAFESILQEVRQLTGGRMLKEQSSSIVQESHKLSGICKDNEFTGQIGDVDRIYGHKSNPISICNDAIDQKQFKTDQSYLSANLSDTGTGTDDDTPNKSRFRIPTSTNYFTCPTSLETANFNTPDIVQPQNSKICKMTTSLTCVDFFESVEYMSSINTPKAKTTTDLMLQSNVISRIYRCPDPHYPASILNPENQHCSILDDLI